MTSPQSSPPEKADGDSTRAVLLSIVVVAGLAELAYAILNLSAMPVYLRDSMGYGESAVTLIGTAFLVCEGVMRGPFGILGDRIGRKWLVMAGPCVSAFTSLLTLAVAPEQWYLFAFLRVLDGLGAAALWPAAFAMIADVAPDHRRSQSMGLFNVTYLVAISLGPFLGGVANDLTRTVLYALNPNGDLANNVDPRHASFYLVSVLFAATAVAAWWRVPHIAPHHARSPRRRETGFDFRSFARALRQIPETLLIAFVTFLGIGMVMLLVKLFALDEFRLSETEFGALLLVPALVIGLASVPLGTVGDRLGKVRAVRLGLALCAFSMWALILIRSHFALILCGSLIGVGFVIAFPSWMAYVSTSCDPSQRGAVVGSVGTAQGLGAMVGAPVGGYLYEHAHIRISALPWLNSHYAPFIGCAALLFTAWLLSLTTIGEDGPRHSGTRRQAAA
ncbi:MAG TPA: MFS transporter [Chthonomonadales bacterium]|nr:MFS transporter [Chthonomonadales bacterium]